MLILITYGEDGTNMRPSGHTLSCEASLSRRHISRILAQLEAWHCLIATAREDRKPVVWAIGKALSGEPMTDHARALDKKGEVLKAREAKKPQPNPEKTRARTIKATNKHLSATPFVRYDDDTRTTVIAIPDLTLVEAQQVIDDEIAVLPAPRIGPDNFLTKPQYASFAAAHTREGEVDAA